MKSDQSPTTSTETASCPYCGVRHGPRCPSVQAIEYHPNGSVKRVEFVKPYPVSWLDPELLRNGPMA